MNPLTRIGCALLPTLLVACAPFGRIGYTEMSPRLDYQGFSFERPPNAHWFLLQREESYTSVTLRRELASSTHSFYANVSLGGIERQPATHEEFAELARSKGQRAPYPVQTERYEQELTTRQNQWCIRLESTNVVLGAPPAPDQELTMIVRGYRCLHPAWPKVTLDFFYSERGLATEIDPELAEEGETFLEGVRIDVAPSTPAS
jgi:hypothetical protein